MQSSLKDVAKLAGVSVRTVSNVVNGHPYVAAATRARVQQAIDELNYRPNMVARSLRQGRSRVLALAVPAIEQPYFGELAGQIVHAAARHSYTVLIDQTDGQRERERDLLEGIGPRLVDGVILSPVALGPKDLRARTDQTPLVLIGEQIYGGPADRVAIDNVAAAHTATAHLLALGRQRVAAIGCAADQDSSAGHLRYLGYAKALNEAGIRPASDLVVAPSHLDRAGGVAAMEQLLRLRERPDAVFCYNDVMALGAVRVLLARGLRVPEDVAVAGIDDIEDGRYSFPSLTTISPDKQQIAELVVDLLMSRIKNGPGRPPRDLQANSTLVVRESTAGTADHTPRVTRQAAR